MTGTSGQSAEPTAIQSPGQQWLARFAWLTVAATSALIVVGAVVTTRDYGLAVPDWPTSFGTFNPPGWWRIEGVNWEHGHRLLGALIGIMVIVLTAWSGAVYRRSKALWLTLAALLAVIVQGVLGGLRVTEVSTELAIVHGCFAQAFFALLVFIAAALSRAGESAAATAGGGGARGGLLTVSWLLLAVAFAQTVIGALMRHYKAGLAIPDFPLAMGRLVPPLESFPVIIHYTHRVWALVVLAVAAALVWRILRDHRHEARLVVGACVLGGLLLLQIALGASVVLSQRGLVSTSLHVLGGAAIIGTGSYLVAVATQPLAAPAAHRHARADTRRSVFDLPAAR